MLPLPRPPRLRARPLWAAVGTATAAGLLLWGAGTARAAEVPPGGKLRLSRAASGAEGGAGGTRRSAQVEAANIAELRSRMNSRDLALLRRADLGDARIDVWLYAPTRQYYVSVSLQGALRRTLKPVNEAEAWLNFDSFRRVAALGEVGRPVLLGQMTASGPAGPAGGGGDFSVNSSNLTSAVNVANSTGLPSAASTDRASRPPPGQDLKSVPVPKERLAAANDVDDMDLEQVRRAREAVTPGATLPVAAAPVASPVTPPVADPSPAAGQVVGQAVETLRRERIGDEVARLVWSADSGQFTASLTRDGRVVGMLRSPDRRVALAAFDDMVSQSRARAVASAAR